jgi:hypothetical protein
LRDFQSRPISLLQPPHHCRGVHFEPKLHAAFGVDPAIELVEDFAIAELYGTDSHKGRSGAIPQRFKV